jgi:hypothetical protein
MTQNKLTDDEAVTGSKICVCYFRYFWKVCNKSQGYFCWKCKKNQPTLMYSIFFWQQCRLQYIVDMLYFATGNMRIKVLRIRTIFVRTRILLFKSSIGLYPDPDPGHCPCKMCANFFQQKIFAPNMDFKPYGNTKY